MNYLCDNFNVMKNITILINGHPNSGKSTLRNKLQDKLNKLDFYIFDYDENLQKLVNNYNMKDRESFRNARLKNISGIISASKDKNIISDLLLTTKEVFNLSTKIKKVGAEVITMRLFCNQDIRERRDRIRKNKNPKAPHGFNNSLNPEPSYVVYDLELDTSTTSSIEISNKILKYLKAKNIL